MGQAVYMHCPSFTTMLVSEIVKYLMTDWPNVHAHMAPFKWPQTSELDVIIINVNVNVMKISCYPGCYAAWQGVFLFWKIISQEGFFCVCVYLFCFVLFFVVLFCFVFCCFVLFCFFDLNGHYFRVQDFFLHSTSLLVSLFTYFSLFAQLQRFAWVRLLRFHPDVLRGPKTIISATLVMHIRYKILLRITVLKTKCTFSEEGSDIVCITSVQYRF